MRWTRLSDLPNAKLVVVAERALLAETQPLAARRAVHFDLDRVTWVHAREHRRRAVQRYREWRASLIRGASILESESRLEIASIGGPFPGV